jgi:hypothetical protein
MAVKSIAIILPGLGINGGINILLNWAVILVKSGYQIDLVLPSPIEDFQVPFLSEEDARLLRPTTVIEARRLRYHAVIATWWASIATMVELKADHYAWFMQAYESQFLELVSPAQADFDELVASQINVITTAHWLEEHILRHYNFEPKRTFCVISGLDKTLWKPVTREPLRPGGRPVNFLIEGPVHDQRKNVAQSLRLLEELGVSYKWVGSTVDSSLTGPNCRGVEERVPYDRMPKIYGWADVLVKASNSEGMFGPPLEMFATGGTAAVWNVQGAEEYMADRFNSRVVPMNSWPRLAEAVLELAEDAAQVRSLQENALATAMAWPTWEDQADQIRSTIDSLLPLGRCSLVRQTAKNQFRTIIHSQPVLIESRRAAAQAARAELQTVRADRAEEQLHRLMSSRSWRLASFIQSAKIWLAPDGSRRWAYTLRTARVISRLGRRIKTAVARRPVSTETSERRRT